MCTLHLLRDISLWISSELSFVCSYSSPIRVIVLIDFFLILNIIVNSSQNRFRGTVHHSVIEIKTIDLKHNKAESMKATLPSTAEGIINTSISVLWCVY